ncbi:MAG: VOC family protein [Acidimicrobiales bacterium]
MARVSTYINTMGRTEEAFRFYADVFGTEIQSVMRFSDMGMTDLPPDEQNGVMHIVLPIIGGHLLMGTDMLASAGHELSVGNNFSINIEPDSKEEADRIFSRLLEGSPENSGPLAVMDWGAYWGSCLDRFGIRWMINLPLAP